MAADPDAITVAEAVEITRLDPVELVGRDELSVVDGTLSRAECEDLSLQLHQRGDPPGYWLSIAQAAEALGISRQYLDRHQLPIRRAHHGGRLIRRHDVELLANAREFRQRAWAVRMGGPDDPDADLGSDPDGVEWISYVDAATLAGRSVTWVRNAANRREIRRRADPGRYHHRWVARADVERLAAARRVGPDRVMRRRVPPAPPGAMTIVDAARTLGVAYGGVKRWLADGRLQVHTRRHPYTYVDEASVRALLLELYDGHDPAGLMTYTQAAAQLGLTIQALRQLVYTGTLTSVGRMRRARLLRSEVAALPRKVELLS